MKKTILMLPSWYPTKKNPFGGCFFREQALAMSKDFNFIVLKYSVKKVLAFIYFLRSFFNLNKPKLIYVQDDQGLQEFSLITFEPQFIVWDLFIARFNTVIRHQKLNPGVGKIEAKQIKTARHKTIETLKKSDKLPHFDCVYTLTSQDMARIGDDFATIYNVPHVTAEHGPFPWPGQVLLDSTVHAIESADAFLAISNDKIRQVLLQNVKVNPIWVGNLCDETKFSISKEIHELPTFLIVAANSFYKNYPLFIRVMNELKQIAEKDFKVIVAGYNANNGYAQNAKELEDIIQNSSFAKNVEMIDVVSRDKIPALYNRCDVFVMTSIQEGLPVSALEASMSGLPVFSTRCGGVEDYVDDNMGRIFDITDYKGIANACNDYLNGKIKFDSKYIREHAVSLFGNEAFTSRMKNVFEQLI